MKTSFTLEEVREAFQTLEDHVAKQGVDAGCVWSIHYAAEDVLRILGGEWGPGEVGPDEDELLQAVLAARSVEEFDAAALLLLLAGTFDDLEDVQAARGGIAANWQPSAMGNEVMLTALEVYGEKRSGALGRGASRSEAETFALMEARRAYRLLVGGGGS